MRKLLVMVVAIHFVLSLSGCSVLFKWIPVRDGVEYEGHSLIRVDNVEVVVRDFGIWNSSGPPYVKLHIKNNGTNTVTFDASACSLKIGRKMVGSELADDELLSVEPDERVKMEMWFDIRLRRIWLEENRRLRNRLSPRILALHLAPIVIEGRERPLPVLTFKNPRP